MLFHALVRGGDRRLRRFCAGRRSSVSAGRAGAVTLRGFVERTCVDSRARSAPRLWTQNTATYGLAHAQRRLCIPAHWLVLHSTVGGIQHRDVGPVRSSTIWNRWRPFCDEALALISKDTLEFLPSVSAPELALGLKAGSFLQITPSERDTLSCSRKGRRRARLVRCSVFRPATSIRF